MDARRPGVMLFIAFFPGALLVSAGACGGSGPVLPAPPGQEARAPRDQVAGNLIQFNDNGAWCWYQDERAVVDAAAGRIVIGSIGNRAGFNGQARDGSVDAVFHNLRTGRSDRRTLKSGFVSYGAGDDHNCPAFLVLPGGDCLAVYAGHNNDYYSYYRISTRGEWSDPEQRFDWRSRPGGADFRTTYSNLFYLAAEKRVYNIVRGRARSPNIAVSDDLGRTWRYGGLLTRPARNIGYVNGYFKYWGNGRDRIDFICTEHHPRDFSTSIYHGYLKGGRTFDSSGKMLDADVMDDQAPAPVDFTPVFKAGAAVEGVPMTRAWTIDLQAYPDGTLAALFKARADDSETDHRFFHARWSGQGWSVSYLCRAGAKLYPSEQDYTGLGALNPGNPDIVYISTSVDPRDGADLKVHEIFKGSAAGRGAAWRWTPVTWRSSRDNLRPIVPAWDNANTALLWWRGTYWSSQNFDAAVVGLVWRAGDAAGPNAYADATALNTRQADGRPLEATGPDNGRGAADNRWYWRGGFGNGGSVLASAEQGGENAPLLKTTVRAAAPGAYDVWANFWANPEEDWRIRAGLEEERMPVFRHMACRQAAGAEYGAPPVLQGPGNTFLYQAYLGRVELGADLAITVFVDDESAAVGAADKRVGGMTRTWYDGVSWSLAVK